MSNSCVLNYFLAPYCVFLPALWSPLRFIWGRVPQEEDSSLIKHHTDKSSPFEMSCFMCLLQVKYFIHRVLCIALIHKNSGNRENVRRLLKVLIYSVNVFAFQWLEEQRNAAKSFPIALYYEKIDH